MKEILHCQEEQSFVPLLESETVYQVPEQAQGVSLGILGNLVEPMWRMIENRGWKCTLKERNGVQDRAHTPSLESDDLSLMVLLA